MTTQVPDVVHKIGIEEYINAFLVDKGVRTGMMLQPADYGERTEADPTMKRIIRMIRASFPSLIPSVTSNREMILSKRRITNREILSEKGLGTILGYPCADEFEAATAVKNSTPTTTFNLMVKLFDNIQTDDHMIQLLANVCLTPAKQPVFEQMARNAEAAIQADPVLSPLVESVFVRVDTNIPHSLLMEKLVRGEDFTEPEMEEFKDVLFNLGFKQEEFPFSFTNPIHRGAAIALLSLYLHNPVEPFYPLQQYPGKDDEVNELTEEFEDELFTALQSAKLIAEGGARRRYRTTTRRAKKN